MEPVAILLGLVVLSLLALVPVFTLILWVRLRELQRRVEQLEGRAQPVAAKPALQVEPRPESVSAPAPVVVSKPVEAPPPLPVEPAAPKVELPAPPAPPPAAPLAPAPAPRPRIEWERWLGVRGAAVLGGIFLAIAGVLFFQYSIQHGLISKELRVVLGVVSGTLAMAGGQFARKRGYEFAGNAITGAGAVILYAAFWAAHALGILPSLVCFAAMALVTAVSCWLSFRVESQLIAWLGLTGGFATPLLVSTGADRPIGLFAYVLVLDLGFLFVAGRRRWPILALWGLLGTMLIEALWVSARMDAHELPIALVSLGAFAVLFVAASALAAKSERGRWMLSQASAVLVPFLFALYFASREDVGYNLWPLALLGVLLAGASLWLARAQGAALVPAGSAAGATALALVWVLSHQLDEPRAWELALSGFVLLSVFAFGREWRRSRVAEAAARGLEDAWLVAIAGLVLDGCIALTRSPLVEPWPFVLLFAVIALALARAGASRRVAWVPLAAAPLAVLGLLGWVCTHRGMAGQLDARELELLAAVLLGAVFAALAWFGREGARAGFLGIAPGAWLACLLSIYLTGESSAPDGLGARLPLLFFAAVGCFGASAAGSWGLVLASAFCCAAGQASVGVWKSGLGRTWNDELTAAIVSLLVLGAWLPLSKARWSRSRGAWVAAALIPLLWVLDVGNAIENLHGTGGEAWIPVPFVLAELAIAAWLLRGAAAESTLARGASWPLLGAIVAASAIPPLWVEHGMPGVWCALASFGAAWLARRRSFAPARAFAVAGALGFLLAGTVAVEDGSFERLGHVLLDGHAFEYLLPALALLAAGVMLEKMARIVCVVAGLLGALLWMTIEVHQAFADGTRFALFWPHDEAREVAVSVAWAVYALALLAFGMRRRQSGLRWASLVLLVIVIGKLFLLDLRELQGLYRVASFLGLAVSLLLVSFAYQRFVFRKSGTQES